MKTVFWKNITEITVTSDWVVIQGIPVRSTIVQITDNKGHEVTLMADIATSLAAFAERGVVSLRRLMDSSAAIGGRGAGRRLTSDNGRVPVHGLLRSQRSFASGRICAASGASPSSSTPHASNRRRTIATDSGVRCPSSAAATYGS